jgi:IclR family KDG regulon transcriptional repressor
MADPDSPGRDGRQGAGPCSTRSPRFGRPCGFRAAGRQPLPQGHALPLRADADRQQGMLSFDPERQTYAPGCGWSGWPMRPGRPRRWRPSRGPSRRLSRDHGETVHLAQLDGGRCCMSTSATRRAGRDVFAGRQGRPGLLHRRRQGDAGLPARGGLLAGLAQQSFHRFTPKTITDRRGHARELAAIRARGYAFDREEHEPGIICIAMPILTRGGPGAGRVSVTSTTTRTIAGRPRRALCRHRAAAAAIAARRRTGAFPTGGGMRTREGRDEDMSGDA